jgi:ATP sulfurylase
MSSPHSANIQRCMAATRSAAAAPPTKEIRLTTTASTCPPHGGTLINRALGGAERDAALERAESLPSITVGSVPASDLELIGNGAFSPLTGFMGEADYHSVVDGMRLAGGLPWSIPVTLAATREDADRLDIGSQVALRDEDGRVLAIMDLAEKYTRDAQHEAQQVFRTTEEAHPGVAGRKARGEGYQGGDVAVQNGPAHPPIPQYPRSPAQKPPKIAQKGWRRVVGLQTPKPKQRAHQ